MKKKLFAVALSTLLVCSMTAALYACGGDEEGDKTYTVTYTATEAGIQGLPTDSAKYQEGDTVTLKSGETIVLENYHFVGWNDGTSVYQGNVEYTMPAKDVTFTAVMEADKTGGENGDGEGDKPIVKNGHKVSFLNGREDAMTVLPDQYEEGDKVTLIGKPDSFTADSGKEFAGWYCIENGEVVYYNVGDEVVMPAYDLYFHANWKTVSITVTYYWGQEYGASVYETQTYPVADDETVTVTLPAAPTKADYTFVGWFRTDNEDVEFTQPTKQDLEHGSIALFAKWAPVQG